MKLSIVIPVYNEEKTLHEILDKIENVEVVDLEGKDIEKEVVMVDDGSTDKTREMLEQLKFNTHYKIFFHEHNIGKGGALLTGFKQSTGDVIIVQDGDMEYDPKDYQKLINPILEGKTEVSFGSRYLSEKIRNRSISFIKKHHERAYNMAYFGNRVLTLMANVLYRAKITDEATCYKMFTKKVLKDIDLKCERFEFCPEFIAKVRKKGYTIYEQPISYYPRTFEEGKKIGWRDGVEAMWTLLKYRIIK